MEREVEWALQTGRMQAELAVLRERAERLAGLLGEVVDGLSFCPLCERERGGYEHGPDGALAHAPDCRLAAELARG